MATLDDVARIALELPEVTETDRRGQRAWSVNGKVFAWERSFSKADLKRYGDVPPPEGPISAVSVADLGEKAAVLAAGEAGFFTIPHFEGFPAVLVNLPEVSPKALRDAVVDGWLARAPARLTRDFVVE
jgi:hypothetical protein